MSISDAVWTEQAQRQDLADSGEASEISRDPRGEQEWCPTCEQGSVIVDHYWFVQLVLGCGHIVEIGEES